MGEKVDMIFMARCLELAKRGAGDVAPNPMVGAVLVHEGKIIGEGYHKKFGEAHAEVNCINDALKNASESISSSVLYVSLEPCAHFGKTPPCADLIIDHKIPHVVIACRDIFSEVNGRGIEKLLTAGVKVTEGVRQKEAVDLNKRFFTFHRLRRPFILLKWAQTNDGFIAGNDNRRLMISNELVKRLVHKWRTEEMAILIGADTAIKDDPLLDNRNWFGKSPVKTVIDPQMRCPQHLRLFQQGQDVIVLNRKKESLEGKLRVVKIEDENFLKGAVNRLYDLKIQSVFVEGGAKTLQSFIDAGLWDEARVITNTSFNAGEGLKAPQLKNAQKVDTESVLNDHLEYFKNAGSGLL